MLLSGTGLEPRFAGANQVVLERKADESAATMQDGAVNLGTITIYGNRSATTLGSTDASVGIVGSDQIRDGQIRSFRDSFRRLGNVIDGDWTDNGFIIRGVNSEGLVPGGAPLASLYVDGVQQTSQGTRRGARSLWDVEQVEVYRGPQSTLSGRAAMAGALYIKTKDPVFEKEGEISGTIGSNGLRGTAFMLNTPLKNNQVALRFSGVFERSENDIEYPTFSSFTHLDDFTTDTNYQIRAKLLFEPKASPSTRALLSYSFSHDDPYVRDIGGPGLGFDFDDERGDFTIPAYVEHRPTDVHNLGLEVTHDLTNALRFTSMTAFSYSDTQRQSPNYRTPGEINTYHGHYRNLLASQEFRLNYEDERLTWVAGLYAAYEHEDNFYDRTIYDYRNQVQRNESSSENYAIFGEATYEVIPTVNVTLGGRLDYTRQDIRQYLERTEPLGGVTTVRTASDNRRSYESARQLFGAAGQAIESDPDLRAFEAKPARPAGPKIAVIAVALAIGIGSFFWADGPMRLRADLIAGIDEMPRVTLGDGSVVQLNAGSAIAVDLDPGQRSVHLMRGQAYFEVAPDRDRPFSVTAGTTTVVALGTAFDVRLGQADIAVTVTEHSVLLDLGEDRTTQLNEGQQGRYQIAGAQLTVEDSDHHRALAWRDGKLLLDDTPIDEIITEIDKRMSGRIFVTGASLDKRRLSGTIDITDPVAALSFIEQALDARTLQIGPMIIMRLD
ncbi:Pesticin receptor precursor [Roseovarius sp. THAF27]|uniref:TonB-dependent receptor domain-containing protein n=1 Tax=Roseovarius sp. THAF27 TaxID=2587850 RepID=UPI0012AAA59E|nr:TonB-dependent receptor [Roseovarius sp. THAF27]QFT81013.1 Pesticin receptor precursor [Roseovarius sp. THAF27]